MRRVKDAVECLDTDSSVRPAAGEVEETEEQQEHREEETEEETEEGPGGPLTHTFRAGALLTSCPADTVLRRVSNTLRFCWVLLSALLDSLTAWLKGLCQEHIDISTVLRMERSMLMQQAKQVGQRPAPPPRAGALTSRCPQGKVPTREAIHLHYQEQMLRSSRESGLDLSRHDDQDPSSAQEEEEESGDEDQEQRAEQTAGEGSGVEVLEEQTPLPVSGEQEEDGGGGGGGGEELPQSSEAATGRRRRARLSRMDRVHSSSSDEELRVTCSDRWVVVQVRGADGLGPHLLP